MTTPPYFIKRKRFWLLGGDFFNLNLKLAPTGSRIEPKTHQKCEMQLRGKRQHPEKSIGCDRNTTYFSFNAHLFIIQLIVAILTYAFRIFSRSEVFRGLLSFLALCSEYSESFS